MASPLAPEPMVPFGRAMREAHFGFAPHYTPLNHGSYGTYPLPVAKARNALLVEVEQAPDPFIGLSLSPSPSTITSATTAATNSFPSTYTSFYHRLSESRALTAKTLNCASDEIVFVPNATTGVDTVLKNICWKKGDVILVYEVVYEAVYSSLEWLVHTFGVRVEVVRIAFPESDDGIVRAMVDTARRVNSNSNPTDNTDEGEEAKEAKERVRLAIIDTIVSMPGLRIPFEKLVPALQAEGAMVLVDAAHGIGQIIIDLKTLQPDFLVTNLHKWFFVPRGCAALYVPKRNQALIRTSLPTSARYRGVIDGGKTERESVFVELFDFVGELLCFLYMPLFAVGIGTMRRKAKDGKMTN
jgi:hercynylcysteine S-oxide lyase